MMTFAESDNSLLDACDRTRSTEARASLQRILWYPLKHRGIFLGPSCSLSADADILRAQEEAKVKLKETHWRCALCGKEFISEHFLDKHLARKHASVHHVGNSTSRICFENLCGIAVPCAPLSEQVVPPVSSLILRDTSKARRIQEATAREDAHDRAKLSLCADRAEIVEQRHRCSNIIQKCITPAVMGSSAEAVVERARLQKLLCVDSRDVECMSYSDRFEWGQRASDDSALSARHTVGWLLLFVLGVVFVTGRLVRPRKHTMEKFMGRTGRRARKRHHGVKFA
jgi:hypothetical protein